jgi:hypothetical protein
LGHSERENDTTNKKLGAAVKLLVFAHQNLEFTKLNGDPTHVEAWWYDGPTKHGDGSRREN